MRTVRVGPSFGLAEVEVVETETPTPAPSEVLIRVRAASLNYRDLLVARGEYNPRFQLPLVLGSDAVGEVVALGDDASDSGIALGDRVCPLVSQGWLDGPPSRNATSRSLGGPLPGVFADYAVVRADSVIRVPDYLDDVEAATLPCAAVTAFSALATQSPVLAGEHVLTLGTGGVSLFALQVARLFGARVLASTRKPEKRARLLELGAEEVIDTNESGWGTRVRRLVGEGVAHVIEIGGADTLSESLSAIRPGGTISLIGVLGGKQLSLDLLPIVMRNVRLQGIFVGHRRTFRALVQAFERHRVRPVIDSVFPIEQTRDAFDRLASGDHFGKVCLRLSD